MTLCTLTKPRNNSNVHEQVHGCTNFSLSTQWAHIQQSKEHTIDTSTNWMQLKIALQCRAKKNTYCMIQFLENSRNRKLICSNKGLPKVQGG